MTASQDIRDDDRFEVINLETDESHGTYPTLDEARGAVRFDKLRAYSIWQGDIEDDDTGRAFIGRIRVECCEPYEGDDNRVRQALGEAPWEAAS